MQLYDIKDTEIELKLCLKCGLNKPLQKFPRVKNKNTGNIYIYNTCYKCKKEKWISSESNKIKKKEGEKKYREANKDKLAIGKHNCYARNKLKYSQRIRLWENDNKDKVLISKKKYDKNKIETINDSYVIDIIRSIYGISVNEIKKHPELIESYRQQIKNKRLLKFIKSKTDGKEKNIKAS